MKEILACLLLLCNLGFAPAEQVNDPNVPVQDPVEWQAPNSVVKEPITSAWLEENLEHVTLELYYMDPCYLKRNTWFVDQLKACCDVHVTVDAETLGQHKELLAQMLDTPVMAVDRKDGFIDAYIYFALCDDTGKTLFDVAMWWGWGYEVVVNGVPCEENDVFYDVLLAFLPPDTALEFEEHLEYWAENKDKGEGRLLLPY